MNALNSSSRDFVPGPGSVSSGPRHPPRLPLLTAVRYPAALVVFVFHLSLPQLGVLPQDSAARTFGWIVSQLGGLGVTFFFILSGFVITWSTRPGDRVTSFWRRRFVKILPLYWIAGITAALVAPSRVSLLPNYLVMGEAWSTDPNMYFGLNPPGWSLCVEALFYLLFPLVAGHRLIAKATKRVVMVAAAVSTTAVVVIVAISTQIHSGPVMAHDSTVHSVQYWMTYVLPVLRLPEFVLGSSAAIAVRNDWLPRITLGPAIVSLVAFYAASLFLPSLWSQRAVLVLPSLWVITALAQKNAHGQATHFSPTALRLGEWSFAFYLFHYPAIELVSRLLSTTIIPEARLRFWVVAIAAAGIATASSWLLYIAVERPLTRAFGGRAISLSFTPSRKATQS